MCFVSSLFFNVDINKKIFLIPESVELLDGPSMKVINKYGLAKRKWPEKDSLFFKFQGLI